MDFEKKISRLIGPFIKIYAGHTGIGKIIVFQFFSKFSSFDSKVYGSGTTYPKINHLSQKTSSQEHF